MPELPDIEAYLAGLEPRIVGQTVASAVLTSPFLLRTARPPLDGLLGRSVIGLRRLGKRIVWELDGELFAVFHLMIAGRLKWLAPGKAAPAGSLITFGFDTGTLALLESGSKKRASLHLVEGAACLAEHDRGGLEPLAATVDQLADALRRERHTLKRSLTDPRLISGIGNAFGDEILHAARLSPVMLTDRLDEAAIARLHAAMVEVLSTWRGRLCAAARERFPEPREVTAFRPEFAVHGKFGQPCPVCGTAVQRIRYASNETNYCPTCQTGGRVLADRGLSRLLGEDWPRTVEELEQMPGLARR